MEVTAWYNYWRDSSSDDKKLRLYISSAGKFGPGAFSIYDEEGMNASYYNEYFSDMLQWFNKGFKKSTGLSFSKE